MQWGLSLVRRFAADEAGTTAIDYGIVVGMIFLAVVAAIGLVTDNTQAMYEYIEASIKAK
ncbi:MAG: Flp family type IVb pilin [Alphaproteobacteria bacterium]|nr:Flp family type IVb pilin [Alphaproteobacteria bacterium]